MLLAPGVEEPRAPRSPAKTSDFESPEDGTRRKSAADRSTQIVLHMSPPEGNATAQFLLAASEQASLWKDDRARRRASTLPSRVSRVITQRGLELVIGWFGSPMY